MLATDSSQNLSLCCHPALAIMVPVQDNDGIVTQGFLVNYWKFNSPNFYGKSVKPKFSESQKASKKTPTNPEELYLWWSFWKM